MGSHSQIRVGIGCLLLAALAGGVAQAQPRPEPWVLPRLEGPVQLDGMSDEPAWQAVEPLPLTMNNPTFRGTPTERSEIRVAYDGEYLYAAGRFYDGDPAGIRGNSLSRDLPSDSDDYFGFILDTFNDNENALAFMTTPAGIRVDQSVFNDARFDPQAMPINESWNTFWDVAARVTDEGWFAEMRIPFSSLRFQDDAGRVVMGLSTWRWIGRKSEGHTFPPIEPKWALGHIQPSIMQDVVLEGVYSERPFYIAPYVLGGVGRASELNDAETAYDITTDPTQDVGLDLKYGITSNLTLDVTANTDFAQVEADDQQVNLTRFSLFFPEKRLFFQERAGIFDFNTGEETRLFYSRRIGLADDGPVRIYGGARVVGRVGAWDVGFLDMQTASAFDLPSENFGVLRLRRRAFNENSFLGGMATTRLGHDGTYNVAYGIDGSIRLRGDDYLLVNAAHTVGDSLGSVGVNGALLRTLLERRSNAGWGYRLGVTRVGPDYDPGVGFIFRTDFTRLGDAVSYTWLMPEDSRFVNTQVVFNGAVYTRNADGTVESVLLNPQYVLFYRTGAYLSIGPQVAYEDLREPFELSDDTEVPEGSYTFYGLTAFYQAPPRLLRMGLLLDAGTFYDGHRVSLSLMPAWNVSRYLELSGEYSFNRVRFPERDAFDADIFRLRVRLALNTHLSLSTFAQYNTFSDALVVNTRLRYNFREGSDLYIVYNESLNTDRYAGTPVLPFTDNRTILLKYTYTFVL